MSTRPSATRRDRVASLAPVAAAIAALLLVSACGSATIKGEIKDDGITLAADHAGPNVRLELHNVGTTPCDVIVILTDLPANALPVKDGRVVIDESGSGGLVRSANDTVGMGHALPGTVFQLDLAMDAAPTSGERVVLCNFTGQYELGRYAALQFDR